VCFSPLVDLAGGALVAAVGIDALRHVGRPGERLLASLPIVFGLHQLVEAAIWWGLDGRLAPTVWRVGLVAYLVIALGLVPVLVPLAVAALEPAHRRWPAAGLTLVGLLVATVLIRAVASSPIGAVAQGHRIGLSVARLDSAGQMHRASQRVVGLPQPGGRYCAAGSCKPALGRSPRRFGDLRRRSGRPIGSDRQRGPQPGPPPPPLRPTSGCAPRSRARPTHPAAVRRNGRRRRGVRLTVVDPPPAPDGGAGQLAWLRRIAPGGARLRAVGCRPPGRRAGGRHPSAAGAELIRGRAGGSARPGSTRNR